LIIQSLRYWVTEMHVDGFRFDLASIFYRGADGEPLEDPPILKAITDDPVLSKAKLIAEPWMLLDFTKSGIFVRTPRVGPSGMESIG